LETSDFTTNAAHALCCSRIIRLVGRLVRGWSIYLMYISLLNNSIATYTAGNSTKSTAFASPS
jgi:hypothetical protein